MLNFEINRFDDYNEVIENILDENSSKIILFNGDLGSGKTTLIQLICKELKIKEKVLSPTFNLINEYQINNDFKVYHFGSLTTRKKKNFIQNRGDKTFLKIWGITIKFFKKIVHTDFRDKLELTLKLNQIIEQMIEKNPHEWIWTHNRWKS